MSIEKLLTENNFCRVTPNIYWLQRDNKKISVSLSHNNETATFKLYFDTNELKISYSDETCSFGNVQFTIDKWIEMLNKNDFMPLTNLIKPIESGSDSTIDLFSGGFAEIDNELNINRLSILSPNADYLYMCSLDGIDLLYNIDNGGCYTIHGKEDCCVSKEDIDKCMSSIVNW